MSHLSSLILKLLPADSRVVLPPGPPHALGALHVSALPRCLRLHLVSLVSLSACEPCPLGQSVGGTSLYPVESKV